MTRRWAHNSAVAYRAGTPKLEADLVLNPGHFLELIRSQSDPD